MSDLSKSKCTGLVWHFTRRVAPVWQKPPTQAEPAGQSSSSLQLICLTAHLPFLQTLPSAQSSSPRQASGEAQRPPRHLRPSPQSLAAVSGVHSATHLPSLAHFWPAGQSLFSVHCGLGVHALFL